MSGQWLAVGPGNSVFLTGYFRGSVNFGHNSVSSLPGSQDIFLAKFSNRLVNSEARKYGDPTQASGNGVAVDTDGGVLLTGAFSGTVNFDGQVYTAQGGRDAFLVKFEHVCDGANCTGCCEGTVWGVCRTRDRDHCAAPGVGCSPCPVNQADGCSADGHCTCGQGPACTAAFRICSGGNCVCQDGRCGADCHICTCADANPATPCGTYPNGCRTCSCSLDGPPGQPCGAWGSCHACTCADINPSMPCGFYPDACRACTCAQDGPFRGHCGTYPSCQSCCGPGTWECCGDDYYCCGSGESCPEPNP